MLLWYDLSPQGLFLAVPQHVCHWERQLRHTVWVSANVLLTPLKTNSSLVLQLGYNLHKFSVVYVGRTKPSVIEKSLLQSPALDSLSDDKAFVSSEERLKTSTTNRKNTDVDCHCGLSTLFFLKEWKMID